MSALKIAQHVPAALAALAETDLSRAEAATIPHIRPFIDPETAMGSAQKRRSLPVVVLAASEHDEQVALIQWWAYECKRHGLPEFALFAIPNAGAGSQRGQAGKMKAEGTRKGIPDLCLAVPRGALHGLYIELKARHGQVRPWQSTAIYYLRLAGYRAEFCYGADKAIAVIHEYLGTV